MIRAKQLGVFSQSARTFILGGSRSKNADGAPACTDDECSISDRHPRVTSNFHAQNNSALPKLKGAFESVLSPHAASGPQNPSFRRVDKHETTDPQADSIRSSKVCSEELIESSASIIGLSEIANEDLKTANHESRLQTLGINDGDPSSLSCRNSSVGKNRGNNGVNKIESTPSEAKAGVPKAGPSVPNTTPMESKSQRAETSKAATNRQNPAHPMKIKGEGRRAIELYRHTLRQLKWGPMAEEALHRIGYKLDPFQANQVIKLLDNYAVAMGFFKWLKHQPGFKHDNHTYTTMVGILGRARQFDAIRELLDEMTSSGCKPNVVTYNRLIHGYGQANYIDEALNVFRRMQEAGCHPDRVTYSTLIDLHAKAGYLEDAMNLYRSMQQAGLSPDTFTYSVMINCLGKAGHLYKADKLFGEMVRVGCAPNLVTYNIMIALHAKARNHPSVLKLHRSMRAAGFRPDKVTYCIVMEVLSHCGRVEEAEALFAEMKRDFVPDEPAYGLLVDMCGKAGDADRARAWYRSMLSAGLRPNVPTCNSLLGAFLRRGRFSEASEILKSMLELGLEPSLQTFTLLLGCCMESKSHMKHCHEMMAVTGHPAHTFLLSLPAAEPGGQNVRDHASSFLDFIHGEDRESKRGIVDSVVDFLHKSGLKEEAGSVWEAAAQRNVYPDVVRQKMSSYWVVNLHVMSDRTAIVALSRTMVWFRRLMLASGVGPERIDIITGWGRRSRVTGASSVRLSVGGLLRLFRFPFFAEKGNSGCFVGCGEALRGWLLNSFVDRMHLL